MFNPSVLVLGGTLVEAHDHVVKPIRELFEQRAGDFVSEPPALEVTKLGRRAGVIGAVVIGLNALYDPRRVDELVASRLTAGADGSANTLA
jgi:predicted NBD/HSP70 family sugar kinase